MKSIFNNFFTRKENLLYLLSAMIPLAFVTWNALLNNFVVERVNFTGQEIGILHSIREVPGFLSFTLVWVLLIFRQQTFAFLSLFLLGFGVAFTGYFTSFTGVLITTFIMSVGFHYLEPLKDSLTMQWTDKSNSPIVFGRLYSIKAFFTFVSLLLAYFFIKVLVLDYKDIYLIMGGLVCIIAVISFFMFKQFESKVKQHNKLILRKKYWLFYVLTFLSGARRQIFVVFAGFLLVEKFGMPIEDMLIFLLISSLLSSYISPKIGKAIKRFGERRILQLEYTLLAFIFVAYAFVDSLALALILYIADHLVFSLSFAIKTFFQKIADPEDISSTTSVSFTINHIAAVILPVILGLLWVGNHSVVFIIGAVLAVTSFVFSSLIPRHTDK
ncbi:MAG: Permease of the major facilitator superfamily [uncultured Campylobacterales bacterium]|uniref:Permease of the major facilitator superfamily n=1 Tax=uncultured Campylobacterales bacterium TaxID=352960 RepID=A0A6S6SCK8_9BACT|nr:MAG: Permease of the major facilitator superfamily [uncultured Campylobacterales bacterium]